MGSSVWTDPVWYAVVIGIVIYLILVCLDACYGFPPIYAVSGGNVVSAISRSSSQVRSCPHLADYAMSAFVPSLRFETLRLKARQQEEAPLEARLPHDGVFFEGGDYSRRGDPRHDDGIALPRCSVWRSDEYFCRSAVWPQPRMPSAHLV